MPDGTYEADFFMEDDGVDSASHPMRVKVIVAADRLTTPDRTSARR